MPPSSPPTSDLKLAPICEPMFRERTVSPKTSPRTSCTSKPATSFVRRDQHRRPPGSVTLTRMTLIGSRADRPPPPGRARRRRATSSRPTTGSRSSTAARRRCIPALKAGLAERGSSSPTSATCCSPTSTSTTPARPGSLVREHPGAAGARLGDRRAAPGRPEPARGERTPALRRRLRRALGRARPRARGERPRRRRRRARARVLPDARPRLPPRLLPARGRDALRGRRGRRPDRPRAASCSRHAAAGRRRRGLVPDDRGDRAPGARAARADPLRRRRRRPRSTSRSRARSWRRGASAAATAWTRTAFVAAARARPARPPSATRPTATSAPPRSGSPTSG